MYDIDVRPLVWLAMFGAACAVIVIVVGVPMGVWWLLHHLSVTLR